LDPGTLERHRDTVAKGIQDERSQSHKERSAAESEFSAAARGFQGAHPTVAPGLTDDVADRRSYMDLLAKIEGTGLPEHEQRFRTLLREQSQQLAAYMLAELRDAPGQVRSRIEPVNRSLSRSEFARNRYLRIDVKDARSVEVRQFMQDLERASTGSWDDQTDNDAEARFLLIERLMVRLGSNAYADTEWRKRCLDTREHVTFTGIEHDASKATTNVYDSAASLSGGQREKLVIFCLAAALRYQLTDQDDAAPRYGTVILDEAFGKTDADYASIIMDVLVEFNLHLVLSTPLKLLPIIDDYVGGITYVTNPNGDASALATFAIADRAQAPGGTTSEG
jgi:uncharacterized protein YPO0396